MTNKVFGGGSKLMVDAASGSPGSKVADGVTKLTDVTAGAAAAAKAADLGVEAVKYGASEIGSGIGSAADTMAGAAVPLNALAIAENAARGRDAYVMKRRVKAAAAKTDDPAVRQILEGAAKEQNREVWRRGGRTVLASAAFSLGLSGLLTGGASLALAGVVFGTIKGGETVVNLYRNHKLSKSRDEAATVLMKRALPPSDSAVASLLREMALGLPEKLDDKAYKKAHKVLKNKLGHFGTQLREEKVGAAVAAVEGEARPQNPMYEHAR